MTGAGGWEAALEKAKAFVAQLTPQEKADMVTGKSNQSLLSFPANICRYTRPMRWVNAPNFPSF
jgi:hypothetical protein